MKEKIKKIWSTIKVYSPLILVIGVVASIVFVFWFCSRFVDNSNKKVVAIAEENTVVETNNVMQSISTYGVMDNIDDLYLLIDTGALFYEDEPFMGMPDTLYPCYLQVGGQKFFFYLSFGEVYEPTDGYAYYILFLDNFGTDFSCADAFYLPLPCEVYIDLDSLYSLIILDNDTLSCIGSFTVDGSSIQCITVSSNSYDKGYEAGYQNGYAMGADDGFSNGYTQGILDANENYEENIQSFKDAYYNEGVRDGLILGYDEGYADGRNELREEIRIEVENEVLTDKDTFLEGLFSIMDAPVRIIREAFNFEIFGFNVSSLIFFALTCVIVVFVIKKIRGD